MAKQQVQTPVIAQAKTAKVSGMVGDTLPCAIVCSTNTGTPFNRAFANYSLLEQWLATDAAAANLDLTTLRIVNVSGY